MAKQGKDGEARREELNRLSVAHASRRFREIDRWWPLYAIKHPKARKEDVARQFLAYVDARKPAGFPTRGPSGPGPEILLEPVEFATDFAQFPDLEISPVCPPVSGNLVSDGSRRDLVDAKNVTSTQAPVIDSFSSTTASFWAGFARLDSFLNDINPFESSTFDRVVHQFTMQVTLPAVTCHKQVRVRTRPFIHLHRGIQILNDWGFFDDTDPARVSVDFATAVLPDGGPFPAPSAYSITAGITRTRSDGAFLQAETSLDRTFAVTPGRRPRVFIGFRVALEGADCRTQLGFAEGALHAHGSFRLPTRGRGLQFTYFGGGVTSRTAGRAGG